jgi:flagellar hook-basal body complex protein FliE
MSNFLIILVDFERTKFEVIQKLVKKFSKITDETKQELISDIEKFDFSKVLEEIIKSAIDSKFDHKDVNAIILVFSEINQIYDKFNVSFSEYLKKAINDINEIINKTPAKNPEEEEKRLLRKKALYRLLIESYLYGLTNDLKAVLELFSQIMKKEQREQFFNDFPILVSLLKVFAEGLFGIKPKSVLKLIENNIIENYELAIVIKKDQLDKFYEGFKNLYYKRILVFIEEEHAILVELEKKNQENMRKLDSSNDINQQYTKQRNLYVKYLGLIGEYAEIMNLDVPELANEKIFRFNEQKKNEIVRYSE